MNVPRLTYSLVVGKMATLHDLQEIYGTQDAYDLLEIMMVRNFNDKVLSEKESV